jgi:hypothetical protein
VRAANDFYWCSNVDPHKKRAGRGLEASARSGVTQGTAKDTIVGRSSKLRLCDMLYVTSVEELNARLGDGELMKIFFTKRSPVIKPTLPAENLRGPQVRTETHTPNRLSPTTLSLFCSTTANFFCLGRSTLTWISSEDK